MTSTATREAKEANSLFQSRGYVNGDKVVLFDGVCNLCNGWVDFVLSSKHGKDFKFAALQSEAGGALMLKFGRDPADLSSLVFIEADRLHIKSTAALKVMQQAGGFLVSSFASLALCIPTAVRDCVYSEVVAPNRYWLFGRKEVCRRPTTAEKSHFL